MVRDHTPANPWEPNEIMGQTKPWYSLIGWSIAAGQSRESVGRTLAPNQKQAGRPDQAASDTSEVASVDSIPAPPLKDPHELGDSPSSGPGIPTNDLTYIAIESLKPVKFLVEHSIL